MSDTFSVTISPRGDVPENWQLKLSELFQRMEWDYLIGKEYGQNNNEHLQIAVSCTLRSDNIRRKIKSELKPIFNDDDERRCWMKINKSDDPMYTFGYCMKEWKPVLNGDIFIEDLCDCSEVPLTKLDTNMRLNKIRECWKHYEHYKKQRGQGNDVIGGWKCKGINGLLPFCLEYAKEFDLINRNIKLRSICVILVNNNLIPFSLGRKIRKDDEVFWKDIVNIELASIKPTPIRRIENINDYYD